MLYANAGVNVSTKTFFEDKIFMINFLFSLNKDFIYYMNEKKNFFFIQADIR